MDALCTCSGLHECEVFGDGPEVEESTEAWEKCEKTQNSHANFIPVRMFSEDHLPGSFGKRRLLEFILLMAKLTVRLKVNHISADRPDGYPFASMKGKDIRTNGSGWVYKVLPGEGPCPCQDRCGQPHHFWWICYVLTACHVVYDGKEANKTEVDLFYDTDKSVEDNEVKTLYGYDVEDNNQSDDFCLLLCATHHKDLVNTLIGLIQKYDREEWAIPSPIISKLCVVISHPHGQPKKVTVGEISSVAPVELDESFLTEFMYTYTAETCRGSSGAPVVCAVSHKKVRIKSEGVWPGAGPHILSFEDGISLNQCGPGIFYVEADILDEKLRLGWLRSLKIGTKYADISVFYIRDSRAGKSSREQKSISGKKLDSLYSCQVPNSCSWSPQLMKSKTNLLDISKLSCSGICLWPRGWKKLAKQDKHSKMFACLFFLNLTPQQFVTESSHVGKIKTDQRSQMGIELLEVQVAAAAAAAAEAAAVTSSESAPSRFLKGLRRENYGGWMFSELGIVDVQMLSGGRLLLADLKNDCVKLFNTQIRGFTPPYRALPQEPTGVSGGPWTQADP
ncbi:hypothetical protein PoB_004876700 [Plakobranchus ocellatus]|uniref:Peptidase S1 domain-containing protein n=1 Tax=Plakobranchus ocellatus TaxID=259542 RepID=A0AAV4BTD2_9GAST|nr:hypothetical protein PoB_004876700 [Plakobranchus ocellatus]